MSFSRFALLLIGATLLANFALVRGTNWLDKRWRSDWYNFSSGGTGVDFAANYGAANCVLAGLNLYEPHEDLEPKFRTSTFPYGPLTAYLFVPFTPLSQESAYKAWLACILLIELLVLYLLSGFFKDRLTFAVALMTLLYFSYPFNFMLERGNIDHLAYACIALTLYFTSLKRNDALAGLFLAAGSLIKVYPGIFLLYFAVKKEWRVAKWTLGWTALLVLLTMKDNAYPSFIANLAGHAANPFIWISNHSVSNFFELLTGNTPLGPLLDGWPKTALKIAFFASLYGPLYFALKNNEHPTPGRRLLEFSAVLPVMTLTPSASHDYNLVVFNLYAAAMLAFSEQAGPKAGPAAAAGEKFLPGLIIAAIVYLYLPPVLRLPGELALFRNKIVPLLMCYAISLRLLYLPENAEAAGKAAPRR